MAQIDEAWADSGEAIEVDDDKEDQESVVSVAKSGRTFRSARRAPTESRVPEGKITWRTARSRMS